MKNIIKYVCIAMIIISSYELIFDISTIVRVGLVGHYIFTLPFISHIAMLIVGVLGLKIRDDDEKQKMLAGISGMQMIILLLAVFVGNSLWVTIKTIGIVDILSIATSVTLLVYYIKGAVRVKKEKQIK